MGLEELLLSIRGYIWRITNCIQSSSLITSSVRTKLLLAVGLKLSPTARIADSVYIGSQKLVMGKETFVNIGSFIDGCDQVIIEDYVRCGPYVKILTGTHKYRNSVIRTRIDDGVLAKPVTIKKGSWIGMGTLILPGVTIAEGCVIAAGSIVTKDTKSNGLYAGSPAKRIKELSTSEDVDAEWFENIT